ILNSSLLEFYHHQKSSMFRGGFFAYGKASLFPLPIKIPEKEIEWQLTEKIADLVFSNYSQPMEDIKSIEWEQEVNELVTELYRMNEFNEKHWK
ncbi:MAG: hypothetical protein ACFFDT_40260, partial [Candidatus Hodarchaeota archaeon]